MVTLQLGTISADLFLKTINKARLENKNQWIAVFAEVNNKSIAIKNYGTWLQVFRINGIEQAAPMELGAKAWQAFIIDRIQGA